MNQHTIVVLASGAVIVVALLDLLFGNTNQAILPSFLGNLLTQNIDALLIAAAVLAIIFL